MNSEANFLWQQPGGNPQHTPVSDGGEPATSAKGDPAQIFTCTSSTWSWSQPTLPPCVPPCFMHGAHKVSDHRGATGVFIPASSAQLARYGRQQLRWAHVICSTLLQGQTIWTRMDGYAAGQYPEGEPRTKAKCERSQQCIACMIAHAERGWMHAAETGRSRRKSLSSLFPWDHGNKDGITERPKVSVAICELPRKTKGVDIQEHVPLFESEFRARRLVYMRYSIQWLWFLLVLGWFIRACEAASGACCETISCYICVCSLLQLDRCNLQATQ